jgi:hypothetical protein
LVQKIAFVSQMASKSNWWKKLKEPFKWEDIYATSFLTHLAKMIQRMISKKRLRIARVASKAVLPIKKSLLIT